MGSEETDAEYLKRTLEDGTFRPDAWVTITGMVWDIEAMERRLVVHVTKRMESASVHDQRFSKLRAAVWAARIEECLRLKALTTP
jgi:hypothetical protein